MSDEIITKSTSLETMAVSAIVLRETSTTRLLFEPVWASPSDHELRGGFRFQRKTAKGSWANIDAGRLSALHQDEEYRLSLKGKEIEILLSRLDDIRETLRAAGFSFGERSILLNERNSNGIFLQISQVNNRDWVIRQIRQLESQGFESLGNVIGTARLENAIQTMSENMDNADESFWQTFFEENAWILQQLFAYPVIYIQGETYLGGKNTTGRQGVGGVATDFLLKSLTYGSFAVIEIKTPMSTLVGGEYRNTGGAGTDANNLVFSISSELTGAIVQMENQIYTATQHFASMIQQSHSDAHPDINQMDPVGVVIAGKIDGLDQSKKKSLSLFRKSLGKNKVITFDEVLQKMNLFKQAVYEI